MKPAALAVLLFASTALAQIGPTRARLLSAGDGAWTVTAGVATNAPGVLGYGINTGGLSIRNATYSFDLGTAGNAFVAMDSSTNIWVHAFGSVNYEATLTAVTFAVVPSFTDGIKMNGLLTFSSGVPTIGSGFGTSPSVTAGKTSAFRINVGTGGVATSGVISFPVAATTGWNCMCNTITTHSATVHVCKQTADTTTSATIGNFNTAGAAAAWVASNIVAVNCVAY